MRNLTKKLVPVLLGLVVGLDASILCSFTESVTTGYLTNALIIFVIVAEFCDKKWARAFNRFSIALIGGISIRETTQLSLVTVFVISFIAIAVVVIVLAAKGAVKAIDEYPDPAEQEKAHHKASN